MEVIRCVNCTDEVAPKCDERFALTRQLIAENAVKSMQGEWSELDPDTLKPVGPAKVEQMLYATEVLRQTYIKGLNAELQTFDCALDSKSIEVKLSTE